MTANSPASASSRSQRRAATAPQGPGPAGPVMEAPSSTHSRPPGPGGVVNRKNLQKKGEEPGMTVSDSSTTSKWAAAPGGKKLDSSSEKDLMRNDQRK